MGNQKKASATLEKRKKHSRTNATKHTSFGGVCRTECHS